MNSLLIISPPLTSPAEPPAGGFLFSSSLAGRHIVVDYYDTNLEYFYYLMEQSRPKALTSWNYLRHHPFFSPPVYQSRVGVIEQELNQVLKTTPGWTITLNNIQFNRISPHQPEQWAAYLRSIPSPATPFSGYIRQRIIPFIRHHSYQAIGLSLSFLSQIYFAIELAIQLKSYGIKLSIGGCLLDSYLKYHPILPPIFSELFTLLEPGDRYNFAGESFNKKSDLNQLHLPNLIIPFGHYLVPQTVIPLLTSKGCYYSQCQFCPEKDNAFSMYQLESLDDYMKEIESHYLDHPIMFHLVDSAVPPSFIKQSLRTFPSTRQYYGFVRFEADFQEPGLMKAMHRSGWRLLQWGLESASPSILRQFMKGIELEKVVPILTKATEAGIRNFLYLLMGLPGETQADRLDSLNFLKQNLPFYHFLNLSIFNLPDQPDIQALCQQWNIQLEDLPRYQGDFSFYLPWREHQGIPRIQARQFINQEIMCDSLLRDKIRATPVPLKSDHAPFIKL